MEVLELPIGKIAVSNRLREVNMEKVRQIAFSMKEMVGKAPRGQMVPIEVTPPDFDGVHTLISGAHRCQAVVEAGFETVRAIIFDGTLEPDHLRLREIDENLYRNDLSPYDFATFIAERAAIFERINGKIKQGPKKLGQVGPNSFTLETAEQLGLSGRSIKRARERVKKIAPEVWFALRGTEIAENGSYLDALSRLTADKQHAVLMAMQSGPGFQYALNLVRGPSAEKQLSPRAEFAELLKLWEKTSPAGQELFRKAIRRKGGAGEG